MAARSWNRVELIGNLTRDPEIRYTPSGAAVATFSIATNRTYVSDGEKKEEADFHRCVAWNKLAELCSQLLKKGHRVFISGRLQNRSWEGQDGQSRNVTEIVIEDMILLTNKGTGAGDYPDEFGEEMPSRQTDEEPAPARSAAKNTAKTEEAESPAQEKPQKEEPDLDDLPF